jgi:hypothetical protein
VLHRRQLWDKTNRREEGPNLSGRAGLWLIAMCDVEEAAIAGFISRPNRRKPDSTGQVRSESSFVRNKFVPQILVFNRKLTARETVCFDL